MTQYVHQFDKLEGLTVYAKDGWDGEWREITDCEVTNISLSTITRGVDTCTITHKYGVLAYPGESDICYHSRYNITSHTYGKVMHGDTILFMGRVESTSLNEQGYCEDGPVGEQTLHLAGGAVYAARLAIWQFLYASPTAKKDKSAYSYKKVLADWSPGYNVAIDVCGTDRRNMGMKRDKESGEEGDFDYYMAPQYIRDNYAYSNMPANNYPVGNSIYKMFAYIGELLATTIKSDNFPRPAIRLDYGTGNEALLEQIIEYKPQTVDSLLNFFKAFLRPDHGLDAVFRPTDDGWDLCVFHTQQQTDEQYYSINRDSPYLASCVLNTDYSKTYDRVRIISDRLLVTQQLYGTLVDSTVNFATEYNIQYLGTNYIEADDSPETHLRFGYIVTDTDDTLSLPVYDKNANETRKQSRNLMTFGRQTFVPSARRDKCLVDSCACQFLIDRNGVDQEYTAASPNLTDPATLGLGYEVLDREVGINISVENVIRLGAGNRPNLQSDNVDYTINWLDRTRPQAIQSIHDYYNSADGVNIYSFPLSSSIDPPDMAIEAAKLRVSYLADCRLQYSTGDQGDEIVLLDDSITTLCTRNKTSVTVQDSGDSGFKQAILRIEQNKGAYINPRFKSTLTYNNTFDCTDVIGKFVRVTREEETPVVLLCTSINWSFSASSVSTVLECDYE